MHKFRKDTKNKELWVFEFVIMGGDIFISILHRPL